MNYVIIVILWHSAFVAKACPGHIQQKGRIATHFSDSPTIPYPIPNPEMTMLLHFLMSVPPSTPEMSTGLIAPPTKLCLNLCTTDPTILRHPGSFNYNQKNEFPLEWSNLAKFHI